MQAKKQAKIQRKSVCSYEKDESTCSLATNMKPFFFEKVNSTKLFRRTRYKVSEK